MIRLGYVSSADDGAASAWGGEIAQALSTHCGPRPWGLGLAPVKGPCRARCRVTALSRAGVSLDKQRSDRGGLLLPVRGYWPMRATCCAGAPSIASFASATSKSSIAWAPACTYGVHALKTPPLVEIHNDGLGQFREQYRARSAQCLVRAHMCRAMCRGGVGARQRGSIRSSLAINPNTPLLGNPQSFVADEISTVKHDSWVDHACDYPCDYLAAACHADFDGSFPMSRHGSNRVIAKGWLLVKPSMR